MHTKDSNSEFEAYDNLVFATGPHAGKTLELPKPQTVSENVGPFKMSKEQIKRRAIAFGRRCYGINQAAQA
ncbi:hypothetical protein [Neptuniibacter sp. QD37_11]|uniref:hypothetical protein n=1 Tax=Neptuniibacter sp. QD37_11 TaxID=3398209 RepID=UPI0039F54ACA